MPSASSTTASGLPRYGDSPNTSTSTKCRLMSRVWTGPCRGRHPVSGRSSSQQGIWAARVAKCATMPAQIAVGDRWIDEVRYRWLVGSQQVPGGVVHELPADLRSALVANAIALDAWNDITPLARNEFICWVEDAKQDKTRQRRIRRTREELEEGQRRPCCWPGCKHRERTGK